MGNWFGVRRSRKAFTLAESLVALALLAGLALLWRPLVTVWVKPQTRDQEVLAGLQAAQQLQEFVAAYPLTVSADGKQLTLIRPNHQGELKRFIVEGVGDSQTTSQLRATTADTGYLPLLKGLKAVTFVTLRPNVVAFTWTFYSEQQVEGVLYGAQTR